MALQNDVDEVIDILLSPFKEITSKALEAFDSAGNDDGKMRTTAEALFMGSMARLSPAPSSQMVESINAPLMELTDLLWDFDDYCTAETFDEKRYTDLLLACRSAAPKIHNEIVRAHLELLSKLSDSSSLPESPSAAHFDVAVPASPTFAVEIDADGAFSMSPGGRRALDQAMIAGVVPTGFRISDALALGVVGSRVTPPPARALPPTPSTRPPRQECKIDEFSSFNRYKGFCSGAKAISRGENGVKQKQRPVHRTLSRVVARCIGCSSELDNQHIENDRANRGKYW
ncbi:hypothetical protein LLEC1_03502 [Akanthomyces lecanii]|uniref:Uncharacterized protein n=1 Tax=Cordyceps confragosa TaxID=2714763 RepID=A0A179I056_CORDF|nr:hypothetical protein LLEC1_03502 [Akanthomyces lecanii]